jgi:hypothetical protein
MLIKTPEQLLPYIKYDKEKTLIATEDMPKELEPMFLEFLQRVKEINEKRKRELMK